MNDPRDVSQVGVPGGSPTDVRTDGRTESLQDLDRYLALLDAHEKSDEIELKIVGERIGETLELIKNPKAPTRYPVRNHEPRTEIPKWIRAGIYHRDGQACVYCHTKYAQLVLDHIVPRSSFRINQIDIADRSDNLVTACWDCNDRKSNYSTRRQFRKPGITRTCPDCLIDMGIDWHPDINDVTYTLPAFCLTHGAVTHVPDITWIG